MEYRPGKVACGSVSEPAYDVWMSYAIKCNCLILKILYKRTLQILIRIILQEDVQSLDYNYAVRRMRSGKNISCLENFSIAAASQPFQNVISPIYPAIV